MSGGAFDYAYMRVHSFCDSLEVKIDTSGEPNEWGDAPHNYECRTLEKLNNMVSRLRKDALLMREIEWLYSGDTSEDSFFRRVAAIEESD